MGNVRALRREKSARGQWGGPRRNSGGRRPGAGRPRKYPGDYGNARSTRDLLRHYPLQASEVLVDCLSHQCDNPSCDCLQIRLAAARDIMDRTGFPRLRAIKPRPEPRDLPIVVQDESQ